MEPDSKNMHFSEEAKKGLYAHSYRLYENGKYKEAADCFQLLCLMDTYIKRNWMGLGASRQMNKEYDKAVQAFAFAAILDKNDPNVHFHAAECFFSLGRKADGMQALASAETVAKSDKKYTNVLSRIALMQEAWCEDKRTIK